jgi:hypothetical protein
VFTSGGVNLRSLKRSAPSAGSGVAGGGEYGHEGEAGFDEEFAAVEVA